MRFFRWKHGTRQHRRRTRTARRIISLILTANRPPETEAVSRRNLIFSALTVETVTDLAERSIGFQSITEAMDTTTAGGEFLLHVMAALAQFERRLNVERSRAGIEAARRRGKHLGRPADLTPDKIAHARKAIESGDQSVTGMAKLLNVHRVTLHKALKRAA
jgi:DNA invertase Pin-like site-specific DNA recombinase